MKMPTLRIGSDTRSIVILAVAGVITCVIVGVIVYLSTVDNSPKPSSTASTQKAVSEKADQAEEAPVVESEPTVDTQTPAESAPTQPQSTTQATTPEVTAEDAAMTRICGGINTYIESVKSANRANTADSNGLGYFDRPEGKADLATVLKHGYNSGLYVTYYDQCVSLGKSSTI